MRGSEAQQMRVKERCSSPRMPLPLRKLGVREKKESGEIVETRAGADGREKKRVESIEEKKCVKTRVREKKVEK